MLGIIGLLGALVAGVVGDALLSVAGNEDEDDGPPADATTTPPETGDLLAEDMPQPDATVADPAFPETDVDAPDTDPAELAPVPQDMPSGDVVRGTDADEFILGKSSADWISGAGGDDALDGAAAADTLLGGTGDDSLSGVGDATVDRLFGGDGDDALQVGAGDIATGDAGADAFALSDYGPDDPPAVITDYTAGQDRIVLMYDAGLHPEPMVQTEAIEGTEDVSVLLDGIQVAIVTGAAGLAWDDIELMAA